MTRTYCFNGLLLLVFALLAGGMVASHGSTTLTESWTVNAAVPDNDPAGLSNTQILTTTIASIESVTVSIVLSSSFAMWNGDYYAYLVHDTGFAVLMNRVGRTATDPDGYGDAGFNVTFDDLATNDIHLYQDVTNPAGGVLTGTWQSDGRNVDPFFAIDTTPRTANLSSFDGLDANGAWTLFVADLAAGGEANLVSWSLTVTGQIPEPSRVLLLFAAFASAVLRRRR
jgi:subtilisin-like proprotein convertase family protein